MRWPKPRSRQVQVRQCASLEASNRHAVEFRALSPEHDITEWRNFRFRQQGGRRRIGLPSSLLGKPAEPERPDGCTPDGNGPQWRRPDRSGNLRIDIYDQSYNVNAENEEHIKKLAIYVDN